MNEKERIYNKIKRRYMYVILANDSLDFKNYLLLMTQLIVLYDM